MYKLILVLVLSASLGGSLLANEREIYGHVRDALSQEIIPGVRVEVKSKNKLTQTDKNGFYKIIATEQDEIIFSGIGYSSKTKIIGNLNEINVELNPITHLVEEQFVIGYGANIPRTKSNNLMKTTYFSLPNSKIQYSESYNKIVENKFVSPVKAPLSTFAIDVDAASYSNIRRMIHSGRLPNKDAVRIEEMINYFQYDLIPPNNGDPVKIYTELSNSPWNKNNQLLRIALKAKDAQIKNLPETNFVFLIDVSGSMNSANKLPLVKSSLKLLVDQIRTKDRVAIVTYSGNTAVRLKSTSGSQKMRIKQVVDELNAGGSTAGADGLKMAYQIARENFIKNGNNRIILATDGDFNVGPSSDQEMEDLIRKESESSVHLTVLGYGMGNIKDSKMEILANMGHGNYSYIDNIAEARKAMITEFGATLFTVAKDVKIQVEFNPYYVQAYRLMGYENRLLEDEDFNNDSTLGGDMGVGHSVTAIYEIIPVGQNNSVFGSVDSLKYQEIKNQKLGEPNGEIATIKMRYKEPQNNKSKLQKVIVQNKTKDINSMSQDFSFATAVAEFGMILRNSEYKQNANYESIITRAKAAKGKDDEGYRAEFIRMVENSKSLTQTIGFATGN